MAAELDPLEEHLLEALRALEPSGTLRAAPAEVEDLWHAQIDSRQAETALREIDRIMVGILQVHVDAEIVERRLEIGIVAAHQEREGFTGFCASHRVEFRLDGPGAELLDARLVHEGFVEGARLAFEIGGLVRCLRGGGFKDIV